MKIRQQGIVHLAPVIVLGILGIALVLFVSQVLTGNFNLNRKASSGEPTPPPSDFGQALQLDGSSYVLADASTSLESERGFTIETWVKPSDVYSTAYIFHKSSGDVTNYYLYSQVNQNAGNANEVELLFRFEATSLGSSCSLVSVSNAVTMSREQLTQWHHVAGVIRDDGWMRIFIDGKGTSDLKMYNEGCVHSNSHKLAIGTQIRNDGQPSGAFRGQIDEVRVSDVARYFNDFEPRRSIFYQDDGTSYLNHFNGTITPEVGTQTTSYGTMRFVRSSINDPLATIAPTATPVAACVRANPTVTLTPPSAQGEAGDPLSYALSVKNNDSSGCSPSQYSFSQQVPSSAWAPYPLMNASINPGQTYQTTIAFTSPTNATVGNYTVGITAVSPTGRASASATYTVAYTISPTFSVSEVTGAKLQVQPSEELPLNITVREAGSREIGPSQFTVGTVVFSSDNVVVSTRNATYSTESNSWEATVVSPSTAGVYKLRVYAQCTNTLPAISDCIALYGSQIHAWEQSFTVVQQTFNNLPVISTAAYHLFAVRRPISLNVAANDKDINDTLRMTFANLPQGVFNDGCTSGKNDAGTRAIVTCRLRGSVQNRGIYTFRVTVRDSRGGSVQKNVTLGIY